jgi:tetratricopeptide (TPR) repeat protein
MGTPNSGYSVSVHIGRSSPLVPSPGVDQSRPRDHYVYAHIDQAGNIFYVGKGCGRRAWSRERHPLWEYYVRSRSHGSFGVQILADNLSPEDAEECEGEWIEQEGKSLVNWVNPGRQYTGGHAQYFRQLVGANRELIARGRQMETEDLHSAASIYESAIARIEEYAALPMEDGLVGEIDLELRLEEGLTGEIEALDRLTICLTKLGQVERALRAADDYFQKYPGNLRSAASRRIKARLFKAVGKQDNGLEASPEFLRVSKLPVAGPPVSRDNLNKVPSDTVWNNLRTMLTELDTESDKVERHFQIKGIVELTYKWRSDPAMRATCLKMGRQHLDEFASITPELSSDFGGWLPRVSTFQNLATVLAEDGEFDAAIQVCELAKSFGLSDGTKGGYDQRIERIRNKQQHAG